MAEPRAVVVRPAVPRDAEVAAALVDLSFRALAAADWSKAAKERFIAESSAEQLRAKIADAAFAALAEMNHAPAGFLLMPTPRVLAMLFVHPDRLRQGVGRALWEAARAWIEASHREVSTVELNATPYAAAAYRALGFVELSRPFHLDGCVATRMACWLPARRLNAQR
jgi:GNAT superfamily N-acetyltransferase